MRPNTLCPPLPARTRPQLDGELVVLDGVAYQLDADGGSNVVGPDALTPYMALTTWQPPRATTLHINCRLQLKGLQAALEASFPSPNLFYAIRIEGRFDSLRARAVRKQDHDVQVSPAAAAALWLLAAGVGGGMRAVALGASARPELVATPPPAAENPTT